MPYDCSDCVTDFAYLVMGTIARLADYPVTDFKMIDFSLHKQLILNPDRIPWNTYHSFPATRSPHRINIMLVTLSKMYVKSMHIKKPRLDKRG
jgi:hypothetical protein